MTKVYTAVANLQLQEKGLLSIEDPVNDYLVFFDLIYPTPKSKPITIRHLLAHSSGLPNNVPEIIGWVHTDKDPECNQTELIKKKLPKYAKLKSELEEVSSYTNIGYMVLAAIIEKVSKQRYEDYVIEHILSPLKMEMTNFVYTPAMEAHEAAGAQWQWDLFTPLLPFLMDNLDDVVRERSAGVIWFNHVYSDQNGPRGLIGTATDTARLLMAFINNDERDRQKILSLASIRLMSKNFNPQIETIHEKRNLIHIIRG